MILLGFAGSYSTQKEIGIAKNLQVTLKNNWHQPRQLQLMHLYISLFWIVLAVHTITG